MTTFLRLPEDSIERIRFLSLYSGISVGWLVLTPGVWKITNMPPKRWGSKVDVLSVLRKRFSREIGTEGLVIKIGTGVYIEGLVIKEDRDVIEVYKQKGEGVRVLHILTLKILIYKCKIPWTTWWHLFIREASTFKQT